MTGDRSLLSLLSFNVLLLMFPVIFAGDSNLSNLKTISSPINFLKNIQGCQKGEKDKCIQDLKKYLEHYGYMSHAHSRRNQSQANEDEFDDILESAIKTYQINYNLNATGVLDAATVSEMVMPRCDVADIINGTTRMRSNTEMHNHTQGSSVSFHTVSRYELYPGHPKWNHSNLTYAFLPGTRNYRKNPIHKAFQLWAAKTHFRFSPIADYYKSNFVISFEKGNHGDNFPFIPGGGKLAHAFRPDDGRIHFNADMPWSVKKVKGRFHIQTAALHEIGHTLGLDHSSIKKAIMFPRLKKRRVKYLNADDIEGIRFLYGLSVPHKSLL